MALATPDIGHASQHLAVGGQALGRLTGQNPGNSVRAWQSWWNENGDTWMAGSPPGPPVSPDSPDR